MSQLLTINCAHCWPLREVVSVQKVRPDHGLDRKLTEKVCQLADKRASFQGTKGPRTLCFRQLPVLPKASTLLVKLREFSSSGLRNTVLCVVWSLQSRPASISNPNSIHPVKEPSADTRARRIQLLPQTRLGHYETFHLASSIPSTFVLDSSAFDPPKNPRRPLDARRHAKLQHEHN